MTPHYRKPDAQECESDLVLCPTCVDVVTGRDKLAFSHPDNQFYRALIHKHRKHYQSTHKRTLKAVVIRDVMQAIQNEGGRFLAIEEDERDSLNVSYREMTENEVLKKISHALRSAKSRNQASTTRASGQSPILDYDGSSSQSSNNSVSNSPSISERSPTISTVASLDEKFRVLKCEQRRIFSALLHDMGDAATDPFEFLGDDSDADSPCDESNATITSFYTLDGSPAKIRF